MKSNPHKLSDILQKQKEELPATDNPRNLPYLLKKHKESDGNTIEKLHNNAKNKISDEEKNLNAIS